MTPLRNIDRVIAPGARDAIGVAVSGAPAIGIHQSATEENTVIVEFELGSFKRASAADILFGAFIVVATLVFDGVFGPVQLSVRTHKLKSTKQCVVVVAPLNGSGETLTIALVSFH